MKKHPEDDLLWGLNMGYIFYGRDPAAEDFNQTSLTVDDAWTELDLSGIVGVGAKLVHLQCLIICINPAEYMAFRKKGDTNWGELVIEGQVASLEHWRTGLVQLDPTGKIEYYKHVNASSTVWVTVFGWWK